MTSEQDIHDSFRLGSPVPLGPSAAAAGANWAIDRYKKAEVYQTAGPNRLQQALFFLTQYSNSRMLLDPDDDDLLHRIIESTQTCFEHYFIARSTTTHSGKLPPEMMRKIEVSLTGAEMADTEINSIGRDTQFELFARAHLVMGNVCIRIAEPDFLFLYCGEVVGLAAKRVKRPKKLRRRFKDAVDQIKKTGHRGFVAVNADLMIRGLSLKENYSDLNIGFQERLENLRQIDEEFASDPLVLGRLVFGTDAIWHTKENPFTLEFKSFRDFHVYPKSIQEMEAADSFFSALSIRIDQRMQQL